MSPRMNAFESWSHIVPSIGLAIPATLVLTAMLSPRRAGLASATALGLAVLFVIGAALTGQRNHVGVRVDVVTCVMLLLVSSLGAVIVRYSWTYLHGDPGLTRYLRWLLLTLGAVTALVIANNLLVVALGWTATSLALHQLLTFYRDRTAALVAAHKKFLVSRLADGCLLACLALVHRDIGSFDLDQITAWVSVHPELTPSLHLAAVLVVIAVALKSAQLPFHGWLIQVMEAPTPVSALLHAGVVNIGGFVLIRLAPWMAHATIAQLLLVVIGLVSAIVAALVMTTRVSVKVALAWSTCAQMGFMLVECGLGLWHLALLHLVAHSLYKAYAFLSAGTVVDAWRRHAMLQRPPMISLLRLGLAAGAACSLGAICFAVVHNRWVVLSSSDEIAVPVLVVLLGLAIIPLVAGKMSGAVVARMAGVVGLFAGWHVAAAHLMPVPVMPTSIVSWLLVGLGFAGLYAVKTTLQRRPRGKLAETLYPWLFAGFYLDERFTRLTFRIWPPRLQPTSASTHIPLSAAFEARV